MLHPRTNSVCMHDVVQVDQTTLTDSHPHDERQWKIPDLINDQAFRTEMIPGVEGTHE